MIKHKKNTSSIDPKITCILMIPLTLFLACKAAQRHDLNVPLQPTNTRPNRTAEKITYAAFSLTNLEIPILHFKKHEKQSLHFFNICPSSEQKSLQTKDCIFGYSANASERLIGLAKGDYDISVMDCLMTENDNKKQPACESVYHFPLTISREPLAQEIAINTLAMDAGNLASQKMQLIDAHLKELRQCLPSKISSYTQLALANTGEASALNLQEYIILLEKTRGDHNLQINPKFKDAFLNDIINHLQRNGLIFDESSDHSLNLIGDDVSLQRTPQTPYKVTLANEATHHEPDFKDKPIKDKIAYWWESKGGYAAGHAVVMIEGGDLKEPFIISWPSGDDLDFDYLKSLDPAGKVEFYVSRERATEAIFTIGSSEIKYRPDSELNPKYTYRDEITKSFTTEVLLSNPDLVKKFKQSREPVDVDKVFKEALKNRHDRLIQFLRDQNIDDKYLSKIATDSDLLKQATLPSGETIESAILRFSQQEVFTVNGEKIAMNPTAQALIQEIDWKNMEIVHLEAYAKQVRQIEWDELTPRLNGLKVAGGFKDGADMRAYVATVTKDFTDFSKQNLDKFFRDTEIAKIIMAETEDIRIKYDNIFQEIQSINDKIADIKDNRPYINVNDEGYEKFYQLYNSCLLAVGRENDDIKRLDELVEALNKKEPALKEGLLSAFGIEEAEFQSLETTLQEIDKFDAENESRIRELEKKKAPFTQQLGEIDKALNERQIVLENAKKGFISSIKEAIDNIHLKLATQRSRYGKGYNVRTCNCSDAAERLVIKLLGLSEKEAAEFIRQAKIFGSTTPETLVSTTRSYLPTSQALPATPAASTPPSTRSRVIPFRLADTSQAETFTKEQIACATKSIESYQPKIKEIDARFD